MMPVTGMRPIVTFSPVMPQKAAGSLTEPPVSVPIAQGARMLVAGRAADSIAQAAGGWTLTWQGGVELDNKTYFPGATSIWAGIADAARNAGGSATLSADGSFTARPDVAVVVFGEAPYAEFEGDRKTLVFDDEEGLALLRKFEAADIPSVAVFLSGRPMFTGKLMNQADAFVAAWLPGTQGNGVADVLVADSAGKPRFEFTGTLPAAWPRTTLLSEGALFPLGFGLNYNARAGDWAMLPELDTQSLLGDSRLWFNAGTPAARAAAIRAWA